MGTFIRMQPLAWSYRQEDDVLILIMDAVCHDDTEHLIIRVDSPKQSVQLECLASGDELPLQIIPLLYKPLATTYLTTSSIVIVRLQRGDANLPSALHADVLGR